MKTTLLLLITIGIYSANAQNLFPVKLNNCKTDGFCLDCGDTKAGYVEAEFEKLLNQLNEELSLQGMKGGIKCQVLVEANGGACVLSHTDQSNHPITEKIIDELNRFKKWTPAVTNGVVESKSSINLRFVISDNKISGEVERVDIQAFEKSFDKPNSPEIYNTTYTYKNENLANYQMTVWNSRNSNLPNNQNDRVSIDQDGLIWVTVDKGLVSFDGKDFKIVGPSKDAQGNILSYYALGIDNKNTKWVYRTKAIYSYDDKDWTQHDPAEIGIDGAYDILNNPATGEIFFCSDEGLTILKDGKWTNISQTQFPDLPSNRVYYAKRDAKNRIWIGTFSGTAMIDENNQLTNFQNSSTVLKGKCITSMDEDENGNLFFTLYEFNSTGAGKVNRNEGIAIRSIDGTIRQYTTENSGMPFNHANCVLYDKSEKVLWISTDRAGLVRYDLKDGWENYHNANSDIPTSYISTMTFDQHGNLYLGTRQGLVKIERKNN